MPVVAAPDRDEAPTTFSDNVISVVRTAVRFDALCSNDAIYIPVVKLPTRLPEPPTSPFISMLVVGIALYIEFPERIKLLKSIEVFKSPTRLALEFRFSDNSIWVDNEAEAFEMAAKAPSIWIAVDNDAAITKEQAKFPSIDIVDVMFDDMLEDETIGDTSKITAGNCVGSNVFNGFPGFLA